MARSWRCCVILLGTLLAALCLDAEISSKSVCIGDSVQVFQNITSPNFKMKITLYKTDADKKEPIAVWYMHNSSKDPNIMDKYKQKVLFESGTILILNFLSSDEATYAILYDIDGWSDRKEVQISALAPPTEHCKPKIRHEENFLIASLNDPENCGKPVVSVQWMEYPGISYKSKTVIELQPGNGAGTYYACIEGEALTCAKNSTEWDKCEHVTIGSTKGSHYSQQGVDTYGKGTEKGKGRKCKYNSPILSPDIPEMKTTNFVIVGIVSIVLIIVTAILILQLWTNVGIAAKYPKRARLAAQMRNRPSSQERNVTDAESEEMAQLGDREMIEML